MTFKPAITLSDAMTDSALFGKVFAAPSFWTWKTIAKLIDGLPLTEPREVELFRQCTGRAHNRKARRAVQKLYNLCGRRAGKDRFASAAAVHRAALYCDWRQYMSAGEQAVVLLLGADKKQAAILKRYCTGLLDAPLLKREVTRITEQGIVEFRNGACLEVATNSASLVRGRSAVAIIGSEVAHWRTDEASASSDEEVHAAALPSLAMTPGGGLVLFQSSVFRKRGLMYRKWKELHGRDGDDVCWFAPSAVMNPKLPAAVVDKAVAEDARRAGAEFQNIWREDVSDFIPLEVLEGCTSPGLVEREPQRGISYCAFSDAAGGTGQDSFTLCVAHQEFADNGTTALVIDALRERQPRFVPASVIAEYADLLKCYHVTQVSGDAFAGGAISYEWEANGIRFKPAEFTTSENYLRALPIFLAKRVRLLDHPKMRAQFAALERRIQGTSNREIVTHPPVSSAHDDLATAVAGVMTLARNDYGAALTRAFGADNDPNAQWRASRLYEHVLRTGGYYAQFGRRWL